jgi:hypothetical protein
MIVARRPAKRAAGVPIASDKERQQDVKIAEENVKEKSNASAVLESVEEDAEEVENPMSEAGRMEYDVDSDTYRQIDVREIRWQRRGHGPLVL